MKKKSVQLTLLALLTSLGVFALAAEGAGQDKGKAAVNRYIGAEKCKSCHSAADGGDQYGAWSKMKHAKAFETLATDEAKKLASAKGIADPQKADECVKCHVTGFGVPDDQIKKGFEKTHGVQCESCHGPGEAHMKARFAAAAAGGGATGYTKIDPAEIVAVPSADVCVTCHNDKSPSYKAFCYHEFNAQIRHLNPKKPRTEVDIGKCPCPKCANGCPDECKKLTALPAK